MTDARSLTVALRGKWSGRSGTACCPAHDDRNPSLSLADGAEGRLLLTCHAGCSFSDIIAALRGLGLLDGRQSFRSPRPICEAKRKAAERAHDVKRSSLASRLWEEARPIRGTPGERYLRGRGITCALPPSLRYRENCWHQSARRLPALVALITTSQGNTCAVHRTYLREDGQGKADVSPCKAMLGPAGGGAVRLSSDPGPLVVAEGLETALSLRCGILPGPARVWAALSAPGMAALRLPARPGKLIVARDGDDAGRAAADTLTTRAYSLGWQVSVLAPPDGFDWNDVLTGKAGDPR